MGEGAGPVPGDEDVGPPEQAVQPVAGMAVVQVQQGRPLAASGVDVQDLDLRQVGRVDPQDVAPEERQGPRRDRPGDDPGEVEDPRPAGQRDGRGVGDRVDGEEVALDGVGLLSCEPLVVVAHPDRDAAGLRSPVLEVLGREVRDGRDGAVIRGVVRKVQRVQQPLTVVGVVGVGAHPAIPGPEEAGQRREGLWGMAVDGQELVAAEGDRHGKWVHQHPLTAQGGKTGKACRRHRAAGQGVDGQARGEGVAAGKRQPVGGEPLVESERGKHLAQQVVHPADARGTVTMRRTARGRGAGACGGRGGGREALRGMSAQGGT